MKQNKMYGVDTVAFLRYLVGNLNEKVEKIFHLAENEKIDLIFPSIVIGELIYTISKKKEIAGSHIETREIQTIVNTILTTSNFKVQDLNNLGWFKFMESKIPELHDRIIVATCLQESVEALITNDPEIIKSNEIKTIW
jgi:predicted nucleic acid-binding protein